MNRNMYDISVTLGETSIDYPGDTPYSCKNNATIADGEKYTLSSLSMSAHSGTHIDAPAHFIRNGKTIDEFGVETFILPATVIDIKNARVITCDELASVNIPPGNAILFRTENSTSGRCRSGHFSEHFVYLNGDAAKWIVEKGAPLAGLDYITIDAYANNDFHAHYTLLSANVLILEGIDLSQVSPGEYTLICLPLKLKGLEASPARAILIDRE